MTTKQTVALIYNLASMGAMALSATCLIAIGLTFRTF